VTYSWYSIHKPRSNSGRTRWRVGSSRLWNLEALMVWEHLAGMRTDSTTLNDRHFKIKDRVENYSPTW